MEAYTSFARVYDTFMDNIPYEEWSGYIIGLLKDYQIENGILLDLGCGTGSLTKLMARHGFDMIGIDNSEEMLEIAMEKKLESGLDILYLLQDMREIELYGTVRAVISICDSMNYIMDEEDLLKVFKLVNNYLDPKGIFIFDLNTKYKYEQILGERVIAENREDCSFIWENYYYGDEEVNEYDLTLFIKDEDNLYRRFLENHYQKVYEPDAVKKLLEKAGMELLAVYDAFTKEPPKNDSERIYVIAREKGK